MKKRHLSVLLVALSLALINAVITVGKLYAGGEAFHRGVGNIFWNVAVEMNAAGSGARAKIRMTLPQDNSRQTVYNESFDHDFEFYTRIRDWTKNRMGFWRNDFLEGANPIHYSFSVGLKAVTYAIPPFLDLPRKKSQLTYPEDIKKWLDPSLHIQSNNPKIKSKLLKIIGNRKNILEIHRYLYDSVRDKIKYKSEKGSKDAKATLDALIADCGGQARLFSALSRAAGIPSRIVGGLILSSGVKRITHVWVENYINSQWIPFDVVNGHFAAMPDNYLELYRGDYALIKHVGLLSFDYYFIMSRSNVPPLDQSWSLYALPFRFQKLVRLLLLIPVGALVVSVFRVLIGVPTFGTFSPILLALAFREMSIWTGLACLTLMVALGWILRSALDKLKILVIPRISIIVTWVVLATILFMLGVQFLGDQRIYFVSFFPMIIITWLIERFSVLQVEDGTLTALKCMAGTLIVAFVAYFLFEIPALRAYLFSFPEFLLLFVSFQLLLGRYTGLRLLEIPRFWELRRQAAGLRKE